MASHRESSTGQFSTKWKMSYNSEPQLLHEEVLAQPNLWVHAPRRVLCPLQRKRESTASGTREGKLLKRYWRDLMLEETRLDTVSPTDVEG